MLSNYFKIAFRTLWKNKLFSFINIFGLGLAIPFALLSFLQLQSSFEFDNFHPDSERIYRIITDENTFDGQKTLYASSPFLLAESLKNDYPVVESSTKTIRAFGWEMSNRLKSLRVNAIYVEPTFFDVFGFILEKGTLPVEPNSLVLSHEMSKKFFNESDPVGKILTHPTYGPFKITGILKPYKKQTQFRSDVMVSMATYVNINNKNPKTTSWANYDAYTFVKIVLNADVHSLNVAIAQIAKKTNPNLIPQKVSNTFRSQSINDISPGFEKLRNNPYVEDILDIAFNFSIPLLILLLAGFNYINLTLARALSRAREVGVRKMMGAVRSQLILQFVSEAIIISIFSLLLGYCFLQIMKQTVHVHWMTWDVENQILIWVVFLFFSLFLGVLAGILPAIILSGFQPAEVLKGNLTPAGFGKISFRKSLMVIQFIVSMVFIFWLGHMYNQFNYMATENDNFNRKGIFNVSLTDDNYGILRDAIFKNKSVENVGLTSIPFGGPPTESAIKSQKNDENIPTYYYAADHHHIDNMQLKFLAGQNIPETISDTAGRYVLVNQKAIEKLHLGSPQESVGKTIFLNNASEVTISGVVQNFCHYNYQFQIEPLVFQYNPSMFQILSIKVNDQTIPSSFFAEMQVLWKKLYPLEQMVGSWFETEMYERYYPAEDMKLLGLASLIILVIAVMGLLGMITYSTEKRVKEIGIRKVMGASVMEIVRILSWSFMKLLFIAGVIALPVGFVSGLFLQKIFIFHNSINVTLMLGLFVFILTFAIGTIVYFSIKAALMNPVKSLKTE